jgi:hypothetical protein
MCNIYLLLMMFKLSEETTVESITAPGKEGDILTQKYKKEYRE